MCGIFGVITKKTEEIDNISIQNQIETLFKSSEARGKDASGIALLTNEEIKIFKAPITASKLIKQKNYQKIISQLADNNEYICIIGHTRLATNGWQKNNDNNQPVLKNGYIVVHNGIITNENNIYKKFPELKKDYEIDTEVFILLLDMYIKKGISLFDSLKEIFKIIEGTISVCVLFEDKNQVLLISNNGSLYVVGDNRSSQFIFASEYSILRDLILNNKINNNFNVQEIKQIQPLDGCLVGLEDVSVYYFSLNNNVYNTEVFKRIVAKRKIIVFEYSDLKDKLSSDANYPMNDLIEKFNREYEKNYLSIKVLKRCVKCVLPETMPFIEFDKNGVCNYCNNYKKIELKGRVELEHELTRYKKGVSGSDCLVMFSGGRDSSYGLHYLKKELGMNPVAFSYDWGMITDLARRNQARLCGKLGVEQIIISADIRKKRDNIRKNILAWFKDPQLGMIPLFMAGDKQFNYHAGKICEKMNLDLTIQCGNMLERTEFKEGFGGININSDKNKFQGYSKTKKIGLLNYYLKNFLKNPSYINSSLVDTLLAFVSFYLIKHNYLYLYRYIKWEETEIDQILQSEYNWEISPDTTTTWRIGDGTAAFYNYIYYTIAGFSENDTFRSNQIREGVITREEAIKKVDKENRPRYDSIRWYCEVINMDFPDTLKKINKVNKLYNVNN
jgi:glutamine---fructose-6-phosphate transaminase (isomerizing)